MKISNSQHQIFNILNMKCLMFNNISILRSSQSESQILFLEAFLILASVRLIEIVLVHYQCKCCHSFCWNFLKWFGILFIINYYYWNYYYSMILLYYHYDTVSGYSCYHYLKFITQKIRLRSKSNISAK